MIFNFKPNACLHFFSAEAASAFTISLALALAADGLRSCPVAKEARGRAMGSDRQRHCHTMTLFLDKTAPADCHTMTLADLTNSKHHTNGFPSGGGSE